jgi:hypothetical protein
MPQGRELMKRFFFDTEVPWALALVRIGVALVVLADLLPRFPHALELYSTAGLPMPVPLWSDQGPCVPALRPEWAVTLHGAAIFLALAVLVGWQTRLALPALFGLYGYFTLLDLPGSMSKYGLLAAHVLLVLVPSQCGAVFSVDALTWRRDRADGPPRAPVWPRRLIQLLVVSLYLGAANEDAGHHPLGQLLAFSTPLVLLLSYATVFFQILFPFLVWVRKVRYWILALGVLFHLSHGPTLDIWIFPAMVVVCYAAFIEEEDCRRFASAARRVAGAWGERSGQEQRRGWALRPGTSSVAFVLALIAFEVAAGAVQRKLDTSQLLAASHSPELPPLAESAGKRLFEERPLQPQDYFLFVDVGSWANQDRLLNSRRRFRLGEELIAYAELLQPHAQLYFTWTLSDQDGNLLAEQHRLAAPQASRDHHRFQLDADMPIGPLDVVLRCAGREVFRRRIELTD